MSNDAAGFAHATDRPVAPPSWAFDAALRRRAFPPDAGSLLPGSLAITRTGLAPAGDDELQTGLRSSHDRPRSLGALPDVVEIEWRSSASILLKGKIGVSPNRVEEEDHQRCQR